MDAPSAARGRSLVPAGDPGVRPAPAGERRCLAIVVARDEEPRLRRRARGACPTRPAGCRWTCWWWTTARSDLTPDIARADGRGGAQPRPTRRGLGAALRTGLEHARDDGYDAAVYLDGDGEYDAAELPAVLDPVARGRAGYVVGSRFLGEREGHDAGTARSPTAAPPRCSAR